MKTSRVVIGAYVALLASTVFVTDSTPTWVRWILVVTLLAPIVAAVVLWPVLFVRSLREVSVPERGGQETRIQVLDGGDRR